MGKIHETGHPGPRGPRGPRGWVKKNSERHEVPVKNVLPGSLEFTQEVSLKTENLKDPMLDWFVTIFPLNVPFWGFIYHHFQTLPQTLKVAPNMEGGNQAVSLHSIAFNIVISWWDA